MSDTDSSANPAQTQDVVVLRPWSIRSAGVATEIVAPDGKGFAQVACRTFEKELATAAYIKRACNHHDELVAVVKETREFFGAYPAISGGIFGIELAKRLDAAIAKVEGRES